jgi:Flp pilus assembly protein TadD
MAEAVLRDVGEGAPDVAAEAEVLAGRAWAAQGDPAEAHRAFRRAVQTLSSIGADRTAAELWFELGALWEGLGDAEASRDAYRSAAASAGIQLRLTVAAPALLRV